MSQIVSGLLWRSAYKFWNKVRSRKLTNTCSGHIIETRDIIAMGIVDFHQDSWEETKSSLP